MTPNRPSRATTPVRNRWLTTGSAVVLVLLAVSGLRPYDRVTWLLEVMPVIIALPVLWATFGASRSPPALRSASSCMPAC